LAVIVRFFVFLIEALVSEIFDLSNMIVVKCKLCPETQHYRLGKWGGGKGRCVGGRERGKRRREKERGGRFPD
jgi:hypothetical protein